MAKVFLEIHNESMPEHVSILLETTGQCGGDAGHGGNARLLFLFQGGNYEVSVDGLPLDSTVRTLQINAKGDWELSSLIAGLRQIVALMPPDILEPSANYSLVVTR